MSAQPPHRGNHLEPVDGEMTIFRMARPASKNVSVSVQASADDFNLSTDDKTTTPPHLSVWVHELTTPTQALAFVGDDKRVVYSIRVASVRGIEVLSYEDRMNVIWTHLEQLYDDASFYEGKPGMEGHAGIVGLSDNQVSQGLTKKQKKRLRKAFWDKLARAVTVDASLVEAELPAW